MSEKRVIAIDLGAESGRVMSGAFDGERLTMTEAHRFPNIPVRAQGTLYWDVLRLWHEIKNGIQKVDAASSIGLDTWGVDVALLDSNGQLLGNPVHYRDSRNDGMMEWVFDRVPRREVFQRTGIQFMQINGLYQLASMVRDKSTQFAAAETLLTIADLFNYWLTGSKTCEFTHVTTLQMYNPQKADWDRELLEAVGIPTHILTAIVQAGTQIGTYQDIPVIAPPCHDTGSAVVGVPTTTSDYAYLSSGTWSLLGLELDHPVITDASYEANLTNEGGYAGTFRLLKNIMGLWIVQQCRRAWRAAGEDYSYDELIPLAEAADPFQSFIDPDDTRFLPMGDMPARIRSFCQKSGQAVPESHGELVRTAYESLAFKYRMVLDQLVAVSGQPVERLHIIGGGSRNTLLCQMTANALGKPVITGPVEATAMGNVIVQLITQGELANLAQAREMLSRTVNTVEYTPQDTSLWEEQFERYKELITLK